jgi:hypothetical protein
MTLLWNRNFMCILWAMKQCVSIQAVVRGHIFAECLGGWISGYKDIGDVADYGLREAGVDINKQKIITIADKDAKIVGVLPRRRHQKFTLHHE